MAAAVKRSEQPQTIPITNIQKIGVLRFHADGGGNTSLAKYVEIKPGETKDVPVEIWKRYAERHDVHAMDRVHFVIGGLKPGEEMKTPTAQSQALALRLKDIEKREAELAEYERKLESTRGELEAMKLGLHEGH